MIATIINMMKILMEKKKIRAWENIWKVQIREIEILRKTWKEILKIKML